MIKNIQKKGKRKQKKKIERHPVAYEPPKTPDFQAYLKLLQLSNTSTHVLIVLDVRNPLSCRYMPYEEPISDKMMFVLNKIDLVPREISLAWYKALSSVAPTFAICATQSVDPIVKYLKDNASSETPMKVLITGISKSGKKTIFDKIEAIPNVEIQKSDSWTWFNPTPDLVSLGACELSSINNNLVTNAKDFLCRCSIHSLMEIFKVTFFSDVSFVLSSIDYNKRTAALEFLRGLVLRKYPYYTLPPAFFVSDTFEGVKDSQKEMFKYSPVNDAFPEPFIILGYGTQNSLKPSILQICQNTLKEKKEKET
ncbi:hypothetical protein TRFO_02225 [Tritrichomonas foetus]|uniref:G domain-containing protein n=1 Tax=Tritrichomonas foetus TaxID=1144522 RepID=A0A1J4JD91_9EUKA|nr:hypothetical protein TRFO_02225 [Tritrichomonas foetus]|eukprot:OHS95244.1 hypothetical protein TRFO_02225 [Tritrichomonas foetus]